MPPVYGTVRVGAAEDRKRGGNGLKVFLDPVALGRAAGDSSQRSVPRRALVGILQLWAPLRRPHARLGGLAMAQPPSSPESFRMTRTCTDCYQPLEAHMPDCRSTIRVATEARAAAKRTLPNVRQCRCGQVFVTHDPQSDMCGLCGVREVAANG